MKSYFPLCCSQISFLPKTSGSSGENSHEFLFPGMPHNSQGQATQEVITKSLAFIFSNFESKYVYYHCLSSQKSAFLNIFQ